MLHTNMGINEAGHLTFAGQDTVLLAKQYKTPLYLLDENRIRENCRAYKKAMKDNFGYEDGVLFASKALSFKGIYKIMADENMCIDVVSPGELYTAIKAGFPVSRGYFHGNAKTDEDIEFAIDSGIGHFVADNREELVKINEYAGKKGIKQKVILRITPGIDPHTHAAITTGKVDSKFGTPIETGQAEEIVSFALGLENIKLDGYHCHVGSQCFDPKPFCDAADIMIKFCKDMENKFGFKCEILNLGGGIGVRYIEEHPKISCAEFLGKMADHIKNSCKNLGVDMPKILIEPGRSIVADAGMTLYTVQSVKTITGYKSYTAIDGGMPDNPRYALYQSDYEVMIANKADRPKDFVCTVAGRCCESGDLIGEDMKLQTPERGDILAVAVTGAYNYAMASNYNRLGKPPIVMLKDGESRVVVKRETFDDLMSQDV